MTLKILNLYAGIGGNRKLWDGDIEVTAVENNRHIAYIYRDFFPKDRIIVADAHQYLLEHYKEYDFIWSSPPCPSHSDIRRCAVHKRQNKAIYPDMKLYEEIILLKHFAPKECKWVVENVRPYYDPLIKPNKSGRHCFWSNFPITFKKSENHIIQDEILESKSVYGFNISDNDIKDKRKILRNLVDPEIGFHVFQLAFKNKQEVLTFA